MGRRFLIDGYNVLHAYGLPRQLGPGGLHHARQRLIHAIARKSAGDIVTIVFDGRQGREETISEKGILVIYSKGSADDHIHMLLSHEATPRNLCVVSSDNMVHARLAADTLPSCRPKSSWRYWNAPRRTSVRPPLLRENQKSRSWDRIERMTPGWKRSAKSTRTRKSKPAKKSCRWTPTWGSKRNREQNACDPHRTESHQTPKGIRRLAPRPDRVSRSDGGLIAD